MGSMYGCGSGMGGFCGPSGCGLFGFSITAKTRLPALPGVPTVDEASLPGFYGLNWHGLWMPRGTPKAIIEKVNDAGVQALAHPGVQQRLADLGHEIFPREQQTPERAAAFQKAEIERWWPVIKAEAMSDSSTTQTENHPPQTKSTIQNVAPPAPAPAQSTNPFRHFGQNENCW
jgi:hypothetical protein